MGFKKKYKLVLLVLCLYLAGCNSKTETEYVEIQNKYKDLHFKYDDVTAVHDDLLTQYDDELQTEMNV
jgi:hypothetical protein